MADSYDTTISVKAGSTDTWLFQLYDDVESAAYSLADITSPKITVKTDRDASTNLLEFTGTVNTTTDIITFTINPGAATAAGVYIWQLEYTDNGTLVIVDGYYKFVVQKAL